MKISKIFGFILLGGIIWLAGLEFEEWFSTPEENGFVSTAEAVVGRPLTPVSVAGVARRTSRRTVRRVR